MGPNSINGLSNAAAMAAISQQSTETPESAKEMTSGSLKINYGDAAKGERLAMSLQRIKDMQLQVQSLVNGRNPNLALAE